MIPEGDIAERLADLVKAELYREVIAPEKAVVVEREDAGEAHVELTLPEGCTCIAWKLGTGRFNFLQVDKNTDGAFFLYHVNGRVEAHIVECKKSVDRSHWGKAVEQMRWTLTKLLALAGALGFGELSAESLSKRNAV